MEIVSRGSATYFVPVSDWDTTAITNFGKWEQAFRVFSNIYTRAYPGKASELIQYNHIIYTASCSYIWDNVYTYDREFRMHISNFPQRSWSVILQQAWSMYLKDRIYREENRCGNRGNYHSANGNAGENPRRSVVDLTKGYAKEDQAVSANTGVPSQSVANSDMEHIYVENDQMRRKLQ